SGPVERGAHSRPVSPADAGRALRRGKIPAASGRRRPESLPATSPGEELSGMRLKGRIIGLGLSGSHCTYDEVIPHIDVLQREGAQVLAVLSFAASQTTTRFTSGEALVTRLREATGFEPIVDMLGAEPLGQRKTLDA